MPVELKSKSYKHSCKAMPKDAEVYLRIEGNNGIAEWNSHHRHKSFFGKVEKINFCPWCGEELKLPE